MKKISYLKDLICFAYKNNPILCIFPIITLLSVGAELLAMLSLYPLSMIATNQPISAKDLIVRILQVLELVPSSKTIVMTFCFLFIFRIITNIVGQHISLKYGKRVLSQLASRAFSNIIKYCPLNEIEQKSIGHYISLAGDESFRASNIVIEIHQLISISILAVLYYVLICWYSPWTAIGLVLFLGVSFVLMLTTFYKVHKLGQMQIQQSKSATTIFLDALNGLRTVRSFFAHDFVVDAYRGKMEVYTHTLFKIDFLNILIKFIPIAFLFVALNAFLFSNLFQRLIENKIDYVFIITMILFLMRFFPVVGQALGVLLRLISDAKATRDVIEVVAFKHNDSAAGEHLNEEIRAVEIKNLSFSYGSSDPIFENLSYRFEAGKSYAIVGPSGIGKSTLFNVLSFLTNFQHGEIRINNRSSKSFNTQSLRKRILLVEQESIIFNDTILNNINFGHQNSQIKVTNACKIACIDDFIHQLPNGYDFMLNYQGQNLSGGQRQRLGLARAILRDPEVLLLDEITSALDQETKRNVVNSILTHCKNKIVIFITHDQIVTEYVDVILNISKNGIKEENITLESCIA